MHLQELANTSKTRLTLWKWLGVKIVSIGRMEKATHHIATISEVCWKIQKQKTFAVSERKGEIHNG